MFVILFHFHVGLIWNTKKLEGKLFYADGMSNNNEILDDLNPSRIFGELKNNYKTLLLFLTTEIIYGLVPLESFKEVAKN